MHVVNLNVVNSKEVFFMQIFKIVLLLVLLLAGVHAKGAKWEKLKLLHKYPPSAFHLKDDIVVLEMRVHDTLNKPSVVLGIYKTPLNLLDAKLRKDFRNTLPNVSPQRDIHKNPAYPNEIYNAFTIDRSGWILRMNEIVDVIHYLGEIDTPAEAQLVLWLHNKHEGVQYRKTSKGYEIIIKYEKSYPLDKGSKKRPEYCYYIREVTDRAIIDKKGKIASYKQLGIAKKKYYSPCLHPSPPEPPILKEK